MEYGIRQYSKRLKGTSCEVERRRGQEGIGGVAWPGDPDSCLQEAIPVASGAGKAVC